jgi:hypothetical protein
MESILLGPARAILEDVQVFVLLLHTAHEVTSLQWSNSTRMSDDDAVGV